VQNTNFMADRSTEIDPVVKFFDERAEDYSREYNHETPGGYALRVRRQKVLAMFDQPGGKVLDVGCGPGVMAPAMIGRGCDFWGVDPSPKMIEICRSRFAENDRIHFLSGDAMGLGLPDDFFDAVLCMGVIDALRDRHRAVREMLRVLKPGGTLIVTFTNFRSPYAWWKNFVFYPAVSVWHALRARMGDRTLKAARRLGGGTRALYNEPTARQLLESEGAEVTQAVFHYFNVFISPLDEIMPSMALWLTKKLEEGAWPRPEWIAAGLILKARKI